MIGAKLFSLLLFGPQTFVRRRVRWVGCNKKTDRGEMKKCIWDLISPMLSVSGDGCWLMLFVHLSLSVPSLSQCSKICIIGVPSHSVSLTGHCQGQPDSVLIARRSILNCHFDSFRGSQWNYLSVRLCCSLLFSYHSRNWLESRFFWKHREMNHHQQ